MSPSRPVAASIVVRALAPLLLASACAPAPRAPGSINRAAFAGSYADSIPGTLVRFHMVAVPAGRVQVDGRTLDVAPFWIGRMEVTWDEYDVFAFRLDLAVQQQALGTDAEARPSRPYGAADRGFGHRGFPAIGMTYDAAVAYTRWLSAKTGREYRLPTDEEWTLAALAGLNTVDVAGVAWHAGVAGGTTRRAGAGAADALGLFDMAGNVAEWVSGSVGPPTIRGGSFADPLEAVGPSARAQQTPDWNATDPQFPKSRWWLSDAPFVGFRLARTGEVRQPQY